MKSFYRAVLAILVAPWLCGISHAESSVIQGSIGDVVRIPITTDCPAQNVVRQYTLIVDGNNTGITAQGCADDPRAVTFLLNRDSGAAAPENTAAWHWMTGFPWEGNGSPLVRALSASVADADGKPVAGPSTTLLFTWSQAWRIAVAAVIAVATVALFLFLGAKTALLRDVGAETNVPFQERTFSLARTQMAWWTSIIVVSYVFEWLALGGVPALSAQPLILMGIYSVLGVSARGVDLSRKTQFPSTTPHFFKDLTSDESGVAVHRVQMLIFTIVVGLMFLNQVFTTCTMPQFDIHTLLLLGISGATYIGFKTTEAQPKLDGTASLTDTASDAFKSGYSTGDAHP